MKLIEILFLSILKWATISSLILQPITGLNKTKRTLVDTATYGEKPAPIFYALPDGARPDYFATTKTFSLAKPPLPTVFDPEVPKQVAAQQVLYEYQQTPTNSVSNVHVKQLFQPLELSDGNTTPQNGQIGQILQQPQQQQQNYQNRNNAQTSETIVNPVHHSSFVNHGQNYAHVQLQPYFPQHTQTQHYVPGRYLYVNGKYVYPSLIPQTHYPSQSQNQFQTFNAPQQSNKLPLSYISFGNPKIMPRQKLTPPPTGAPMNYNKFSPPQKQDIQQITKPVKPSPKVREEVEEDEEEENSSLEKEENIEDEEDDKSSYEAEENEENDDHYGKYHEDDDEDLGSYIENHSEEENEDDDSDRKASKVVRVHNSPSKKRKNKANKKDYNDKDNYAWSKSYSHSSRYENGKKKADKVKENKKYDSYKQKADKRKNKSNKGADRIQGRYSQNVPVVQEHKLFKEKWYVSQSKNGDKH